MSVGVSGLTDISDIMSDKFFDVIINTWKVPLRWQTGFERQGHDYVRVSITLSSSTGA